MFSNFLIEINTQLNSAIEQNLEQVNIAAVNTVSPENIARQKSVHENAARALASDIQINPICTVIVKTPDFLDIIAENNFAY